MADPYGTSRNYAAAQSILLCLFAAAFFLDGFKIVCLTTYRSYW